MTLLGVMLVRVFIPRVGIVVVFPARNLSEGSRRVAPNSSNARLWGMKGDLVMTKEK